MSHFTDQQKAAIKAAILADPTLAAMTSGPGTDYGAIAAAMNLDASPAFVVWKTSVTRAEIQSDAAFDWTQVDNLSTGSKYRIWEWMFQSGSVDPSQANIRGGIDATWVGTAALLAVRASVYTHCKRNARRIEKVFTTGTGTTATPGFLVYEGALDLGHVAEIFSGS
jgi:hypothetical protein